MTREKKLKSLLDELFWQQQLTHVGDGWRGRAVRAVAIRALIDAVKAAQKGTR